MEWAMIFLFIGLKVPLLTLCYLVWWAIKQTPEEDEQPGGGGRRRPHPSRPLPRAPRRGPHGGAPAMPSPPRVRPLNARARTLPKRTSSSTGER